MPDNKRRELTLPPDDDQLEIPDKFTIERGIPNAIDQLARETMLTASKRQGEAFDRFLNRKNLPAREE